MEKKNSKKISFPSVLIKEFVLRKLRKEKLQLFFSFLFLIFIVFLAIENNVFFIRVPDELIVKNVVIKQTSAIITGQPVKWTILVKRDQIKQNQYLVQLPKGAKNITIKTISADQAEQILAQPTKELTIKERQNLASITPLKPKSTFAKLTSSMFASFADIVVRLTGALGDAIVGPENQDVIQTSNSQFVDLSEQAPPQEQIQQENKEKDKKSDKDKEIKEDVFREPIIGRLLSIKPLGTQETTKGKEEKEKEKKEQEEKEKEKKEQEEKDKEEKDKEEEKVSGGTGYIVIEYETQGPIITEQKTSRGKFVIVSSPPTTKTPISKVKTNALNKLTEVLEEKAKKTKDQKSTDETEQPALQEEQAPSQPPAPTIPETPVLTNVLAYTTIPEIYATDQKNKIQIRWFNNNNQLMPFEVFDLNENGKIDYIEWIVPHLSEQIFEIIFISKAFQLDSNQNIIADIYDTVQAKDGNYATIPDGNYVRVTFEQILDNTKDITVYARPNTKDQIPKIEVYPVYTDEQGNITEGGLIATFPEITTEDTYKILLADLQTPTDVFDLKIIATSDVAIDIDYIVDPVGWLTDWDYRKKITIQNANVSADLTNFPLYVDITADTDIGAISNADGFDHRFTASDGTTLLKFEREFFSITGGSATGGYWVKTNVTTATATDIYIYYRSTDTADGADSANVWDANFKGVWHFPDGSTLAALDSTANHNDATEIRASATTGKIGGAAQFSGYQPRIVLTENGSLDIVTALSISLWHRQDVMPPGYAAYPVEKWSDTPDANFVLYFFGTASGIAGTVRFFANAGGAWKAISGSTVIADAGWHHIGLSYTTGGGGQLYVDGTPVGGLTGGGNLTTNNVAARFNPDNVATMDESRISDSARSAPWIDFEYHNMAEADNELTWGSEESPPAFDQKHFKIYQDDAAMNSATAFADEDINYFMPTGKNFRIRFEVANTGGSAGNITRRLEFKEDSGEWTQITTDSNNVRLVNSSNFTDGDATTTALTATGTFAAGQGKDTGSDASQISLTNAYYTEDEYALKFETGAAGHSYQFRITNAGVALDTYTKTPTILAGWAYRKKITIDHTYVDSDLTDFPLYVKISSDSDMSTAQNDGDDIRFTQSDGVTLLKHEEESWSGGGGSAVTADFWVEVPTVAGASNTEIYIYYGNSSASDGQDAANVWDSNFSSVYHLPEASGTLYDSKGNNNGTGAGSLPNAATGVVSSGQSGDGTGDAVLLGDVAAWELGAANTATIECWVKPTDTSGSGWQVIMGRINGSTSVSGWTWTLFAYLGSGGGNFAWGDGGDAGYDLQSTISAYTNNNWYHIAVVIPAQSSSIKFYVNGAYQSAKDVNRANGQLTQSTNNFQLFSSDATGEGDKSTAGVMDEVRISTGINRSAAWLKFEYNNIAQADNELSFAAEEENDSDVAPPVQSAWAPATTKVINTATPTITLTLNENGDCKSSTTDQAYADMTTDCSGDGTTSISCTTSNLGADGAKNVYIACEDTLLNKDTAATNTGLAYTVDTANPTVTITSPTNSTYYNNTSVSFSAFQSDTNTGFIVPNLDSSLVSWWRMDDVDGSGNPTDYIGSNNGTKYGDAAQTANGKFGKGFTFDGTGDYVSVADNDSLDVNRITLSLWVKLNGNQIMYSRLIQKDDGSLTTAYWIQFNNATTPVFYTGNTNVYTNVSFGILDTNWHLLTGVYDGNNLKSYVDGNFVEQAPYIGNILPSSAPLLIGQYSGGGYNFNGSMDDVMIFNRALTTDEITALYNGTAISHSSTLSEASHTYKVYSEDLAANVGSSGPNTFTVDVTAPTNQNTVFASSVSKQGGASVTIVSSGDATNNVWFAPSGTTTFTAGPTMTTAGGTATTILAPTTAGAYRMFVIDAAGNYSTQSTAILTVDNTAPTVSSVAVQTGLTVNIVFSETMGTGVTTASNYTVSGTGKGTLASNPNTVALVSGSTYVLTWSSGEMFNAGDITVAVANAQDAVGNAVGSPNSGTHTGGGIGVAPTLSFTDDVAAGPVASDTIAGSWGDATTKKWDYDSDGVCSATSGDYSKTDSDSMDQSVQTNNTKYICLYGADAAGNSATQVSANDINIDITAPTGSGISSITADSTTQLTVVAATATDAGVGLHATPYQIQETTGNSGATSSSFQASNTYTDQNLTPNTQYTYKVRAKDSLGNTSDYSTTSSKYTLADIPGTPTLSVDSSTQITVTLTTDLNPTGTYYYIENTTASTNSGWITDASWISSGLTCNTSYTFRVKARNGNNTETDYSSTASATTSACPSQITGGGGGGLPPEAYLPPTPPLNGFQLLINGGSSITDNQNVNLTIRGSSNTFRMSISNDPNFTNAIQESYTITKPWRLSDGQGQKTVYLKFFTSWGVSSEVITATIKYQVPSIITPLINIIAPPTPPITPPVIEPIPPLPPVTEVVKPEAPLSMQDIWNLLPTQAINQFVLSPIPQDISDLVQKFPGLEKIFEDIGILKITDIGKLAGNNLILPNFSQIVNPTALSLEPGQIVVPDSTGSISLTTGQLANLEGIPLEELTTSVKERIPTEILFVKTSGGLVDFNTTLSLNEQGHPQQQFTTLVNQLLQLIVKPDKPARAVRGYFVFKQSGAKSTSKISASDFTASLLQQEIDINQIRESIGSEQALVLSIFDFADPDKDGIWTADVMTPPVDGQYDIIVVIDYLDQRLQPKELNLVAVVDPEGYVYTTINRGELRINNAKVSLFWLNPETNSYQLWPAKDFQQVNPQITDATGKYSFLVSEGTYYLTVQAQGYAKYQSDDFDVEKEKGVHFNIELKSYGWWMQLVDWKTMIIIIVLLFLGYNFYKDRKLKLELAKLKK